MTWSDRAVYVISTILTSLVAISYITLFVSVLYTTYTVYNIDRRFDKLDVEYSELMDVYDRATVNLIKGESSE